ncbi:Protein jagged-1b, partial [Frankliniella fusca]
MLNEENKNAVIAKVRALISEVEGEDADHPDADDATPPPPKVARLDKYAKYKRQPQNQPLDEVSRYMEMSVTVAPDQLLKWWKMMDRPDGLPKLAKLAIREL